MNTTVRVSASGAIAKMGRITAALSGPEFARAGMAGAKVMEAYAKNEAPRDTGSLSRSIQSEVMAANVARFVIEIATNLIYAAVQEFGGTIRAKNAPYLVFKTKDGSWHSVKEVTIPAHPYMRPAADIAGPQAQQVVAAIVHRMVEAA